MARKTREKEEDTTGGRERYNLFFCEREGERERNGRQGTYSGGEVSS